MHMYIHGAAKKYPLRFLQFYRQSPVISERSFTNILLVNIRTYYYYHHQSISLLRLKL